MNFYRRILPPVILILATLACRAADPVLDSILEPGVQGGDQSATQIAEYVYSGMTLTAEAAGPTQTETPSPTPEVLPSATPQQITQSPPLTVLETPTAAMVAKLPTPTDEPPAAATASACRYAAVVDAENIPAGKEIPMNHKFTKTWKIRNSGNCDWTPDFSFVCMSNCDSFKAPSAIPLSIRTIPPKGTTEIRMDLQAPKGDKVFNKKVSVTFFIRGAGKLIGIGSDGKTPFAVTIKATD